MANDPFYKRQAWKRLRLVVLAEEPFCRYCTRMGYTVPATVVDHIVPRRERPDLALVRDNLQALCDYCHNSVKAREEGQGRALGCDKDGVPLGGWG